MTYLVQNLEIHFSMKMLFQFDRWERAKSSVTGALKKRRWEK